MTTTPIIHAWRKSSYSDKNGGLCVEVADGVPGVVPVRDSKSPADPHLTIPNGAWRAFVEHIKA